MLYSKQSDRWLWPKGLKHPGGKSCLNIPQITIPLPNYSCVWYPLYWQTWQREALSYWEEVLPSVLRKGTGVFKWKVIGFIHLKDMLNLLFIDSKQIQNFIFTLQIHTCSRIVFNYIIFENGGVYSRCTGLVSCPLEMV